jgi:hypothetical protein
MLLGNCRKLIRVPCPKSPMEMPTVYSNQTTTLTNGDVKAKRSPLGSRQFQWEWLGDMATIQPIYDMLSGRWGPGPFYFLNPFAMANVNLLPPHWASPFLSVQKRGHFATVLMLERYNFPGYSPNPFRVENYAGGSSTTELPLDAFRVAFPVADVGVTGNLSPDFYSLTAGSTPFAAVPVPANYYTTLFAWGSDSATYPILRVVMVTPNGGTITSGNALRATATPGSYNLAPTSADRYALVWLTQPASNPADSVATLHALSLQIGASGYPSAPAAFPVGRGQGAVDIVEDTLSYTGYTASDVGKKQVGLSVQMGEVHLPW